MQDAHGEKRGPRGFQPTLHAGELFKRDSQADGHNVLMN